MTAGPGVVADRSRLQEGCRSVGRGKRKFQGDRKRAGSRTQRRYSCESRHWPLSS